eukprot:6213724-Pleurochrysis_carterae.AAC.2
MRTCRLPTVSRAVAPINVPPSTSPSGCLKHQHASRVSPSYTCLRVGRQAQKSGGSKYRNVTCIALYGTSAEPWPDLRGPRCVVIQQSVSVLERDGAGGEGVGGREEEVGVHAEVHALAVQDEAQLILARRFAQLLRDFLRAEAVHVVVHLRSCSCAPRFSQG